MYASLYVAGILLTVVPPLIVGAAPLGIILVPPYYPPKLGTYWLPQAYPPGVKLPVGPSYALGTAPPIDVPYPPEL